MGFPDAMLEVAIRAVRDTGNFQFGSLHVGPAGVTGANEASGGSPAYARKPITWTDGGIDGALAAALLAFNVLPGDYVELGFWSAVTGGTFGGSIALSSKASPNAQGVIQVTPTLTGRAQVQ